MILQNGYPLLFERCIIKAFLPKHQKITVTGLPITIGSAVYWKTLCKYHLIIASLSYKTQFSH